MTIVHLIVFVLMPLRISCQAGCQQNAILLSMNIYYTCIDTINKMLFSAQYYEMNSFSAQQICQTATASLAQCRRTAEQNLGGCLDFNQRVSLQYTFAAAEAGVRYWCSGYGINLQEFYRLLGPDCFYRQQSMLRNCEKEYPLLNIFLKDFDRFYCDIQSNVASCIQQVYDNCLRNNSRIVHGYLDAMLRSTPCRNTAFLTDQAASPGIQFSLLVAALMFILSFTTKISVWTNVGLSSRRNYQC